MIFSINRVLAKISFYSKSANYFIETDNTHCKQSNPFTLFVPLISVLFLASSIACSSGSSSEKTEAPYIYSPPTAKNDGWQVADLNQLNIDPTPIETLIDNIDNQRAGFLHIDSLVIAFNGELVFEQQLRDSLDVADSWAGNTDIDLHVINSVTKSVNSVLLGIAIDQQHISGVNERVHDYFQHKLPIANWTDDKQAITIENWLNMRSGYQWDEWNVNYLNPSNLNAQMNSASDPIQFLLDRPMATTPGSTFAYSTGISFGLGRIIQLASGQSVNNYLVENLLTPLNITKYDYWQLDNQYHSGSALYLTTRDMAKFGQLFLNGGLWNGVRIVSEEWVNTSIQQRVNVNESGTVGYGYQWWMGQFTANGQVYSTYYADGFGGQYIFVFPALNLVVAMTGSAYDDGQPEERSIRNILEQSILPSFIDN